MQCFFQEKSRTKNTQKLKLGIQNIQKNVPIIDYLRIFDNPFAQPQGGIQTHFRPQENVSFLFNFTRILSFFWDLGLALFDIPKDVVFAEILGFSNIFGFPVVNWATKWNKTVNFRCLPFILKFKFLEDFLNTVFSLLETTSCQNFSKTEQCLGV